ncbi:hypothetical protein MAR_015845 [Mya arenaria]|uniref:Uncharacterized protein n=1 Tax=Mya arenaria TaxID=6604 RepID=A0ABY7FLR6_MYAAR|nr:hypothetical protein MAR_015845 [Mya arenaria]
MPFMAVSGARANDHIGMARIGTTNFLFNRTFNCD